MKALGSKHEHPSQSDRQQANSAARGQGQWWGHPAGTAVDGCPSLGAICHSIGCHLSKAGKTGCNEQQIKTAMVAAALLLECHHKAETTARHHRSSIDL